MSRYETRKNHTKTFPMMKKIISYFLLGFKRVVLKPIERVEQRVEDAQPISNQFEGYETPTELPKDIKKDIVSYKAEQLIQVDIRTPETRFFEVDDQEHQRKIAYTVSGDVNGEHILLCLPGLLETKATFQILHAYFLQFSGFQVISIDLSGRGESDHIGKTQTYKMSLYLSDVRRFIEEVILYEQNSLPKITILGTSMGGVLAMYLTQLFPKNISEIILNDIAITVNWTSLYALYKSMKHELGYREVRQLAQELQVDERAVSDVQLPGHFDLAYRADIWGMNFHEALESYQGKVALIYGSESKICTQRRVDDALKIYPKMHNLKVMGAGHPVPFDLHVCEFIQSEMGA